MRVMVTREPRIFDSQIMASLRQGTSFFASTCLLAVGGVHGDSRSSTEKSSRQSSSPQQQPCEIIASSPSVMRSPPRRQYESRDASSSKIR
ncbi:DUF599 family protein [Rubripirellula tenax]|uniref:DUF599 family protein n=1 Tax=Rubripirellula tenax TaxID=2528015 RepID=UPI0036F32370